MSRRRFSDHESPIGEANVLPIMNIMFLLIPALLLAMEVASMAAVAISPPKFCAGDKKPTDVPIERPLDLSVTILADGFRVVYTSQQDAADLGRAQDSGAPSIPLAIPDAPPSDYDRYDYAELERRAKQLKAYYPHETVVRVSAENDIPAQVLINTLDALRGRECRLRDVKSDEPIPEECLFYQPVVEAGR